jgi:hypothetical protein
VPLSSVDASHVTVRLVWPSEVGGVDDAARPVGTDGGVVSVGGGGGGGGGGLPEPITLFSVAAGCGSIR